MKHEIELRLRQVEQQRGVKIIYAAESGSRAWGLASPDSDYDVRFVYVQPREEYLRIDEQPDFIEWQLDAVYDINGWDLKKTLSQIASGNATVFEWMNSPVSTGPHSSGRICARYSDSIFHKRPRYAIISELQ